MEKRTVYFLVWVSSVILVNCAKELDRDSPKPVVDGTLHASLPAGDPKRCYALLNDKNLIRYETLPGNGWDNLRNKDAGVVVNFNYSTCKTTDDGRYIIPDTIYTVPIKSSRVETYAELFDHWMNYTSTTSSSINVGAGLTLTHFGISGTFSHETESIRSHQINDKSVTTRVQVRYVRYTAKLQPDTPLHPAFKSRLLSIASYLQLNKTNMATYESELLVRDFGTHIVTSVDSGAALVQLDDIKSSFNRDYSASKSKITASASASFFSGIFKINANYEHQTTKEMIDQYLGNRSHSKVETYGGPVFKPVNFSLNDWADGIGDELVALDRSGDPLYFLITPYALPELPLSVVYKLTQSVKSAVEMYYKFNTYRGCTNPDSPNFSFQANVDDGTCSAPNTNFTFGGVYQTCTLSGSLSTNLCAGLNQKNPLAGGYSCPPNYESVLLETFTRTGSETRQSCHRHWWHTSCHDYTVYGMAKYSAYWCVAKGQVSSQTGFLFGGLYTTTVSNPLTQTKTCPLYYYPLTMGSDIKVCVSDDYELAYQYSVPFAGFYSCKTGNPLMHGLHTSSNKLKAGQVNSLGSFFQASQENWPKGCPNGYSQHIATVENGCEIDYCVKGGAFSPTGLPPVRQPPFMQLPANAFSDSVSYTFSRDGQDWDIISEEKPVNGASEKIASVDPTSKSDDSGLSKGAIAGISVVATIACIVAASIVIVKYRKYKSQYRPLQMSAPLMRERSPRSRVQYDTDYGTRNDTMTEVHVDT